MYLASFRSNIIILIPQLSNFATGRIPTLAIHRHVAPATNSFLSLSSFLFLPSLHPPSLHPPLSLSYIEPFARPYEYFGICYGDLLRGLRRRPMKKEGRKIRETRGQRRREARACTRSRVSTRSLSRVRAGKWKRRREKERVLIPPSLQEQEPLAGLTSLPLRSTRRLLCAAYQFA